jgi:hypothetical protein
MEEKARQPETKPGAITRHKAGLRDASEAEPKSQNLRMKRQKGHKFVS